MDISTTTSAILVLLSGILCASLLYWYWWYWPEGERSASEGRRLSPPELPVGSVGGKKGGAGVEECAVCLTEFEEGEKVKAIPGCGHVFHPPCIDRWLISSCSCPLCRCSEMSPCSKLHANSIMDGSVQKMILVKKTGSASLA